MANRTVITPQAAPMGVRKSLNHPPENSDIVSLSECWPSREGGSKRCSNRVHPGLSGGKYLLFVRWKTHPGLNVVAVNRFDVAAALRRHLAR